MVERKRDSRTELEELKQLPKVKAVREDTVTDGVLGPAPGTVAPEKRSYSPPSFASPAEMAAIERDALSEGARVVKPAENRPEPRKRQDTPAWIEPPWWRTTGGTVRVLGALFTGLAAIGAGSWFATRPEEKPQPAQVADVACPKFEDQDAPRGALCMRIFQLEQALGRVQAEQERRRARDERERRMLGDLPEVKGPR